MRVTPDIVVLGCTFAGYVAGTLIGLIVAYLKFWS